MTAPTATEQGYTTYTCAVCGYSYKDNYVQSLGVDYTVSFSVPEGVEQPEDMVSNTNTGITLPTVTGHEGYQFAGWVETACDNAAVRPEAILNGQYIAQSNVTLYALFKHVVDDGTTVGNSDSFELVTEAPDNWSGNYVITYKNNTTSLAAMKGIDGGKSYETASNGGASAYSITGMILEDNVLSNVSENYIYTVSTEESGNYSIKSVSKESYVAIQSNTLMSLSGYAEATCDWTLGLKEDGTAMIKLAAGGSYPYVAFGSSRFWCHSATADIYLWRQATGTTYWTTVIAQEDLVNLYFVDQDNNETAYVYASGTETENAAFPRRCPHCAWHG